MGTFREPRRGNLGSLSIAGCHSSNIDGRPSRAGNSGGAVSDCADELKIDNKLFSGESHRRQSRPNLQRAANKDSSVTLGPGDKAGPSDEQTGRHCEA